MKKFHISWLPDLLIPAYILIFRHFFTRIVKCSRDEFIKVMAKVSRFSHANSTINNSMAKSASMCEFREFLSYNQRSYYYKRDRISLVMSMWNTFLSNIFILFRLSMKSSFSNG